MEARGCIKTSFMKVVAHKHIAAFVFTGVLMLCGNHSFAQKQPNFGLTKKQPATTLPKGKRLFKQR